MPDFSKQERNVKGYVKYFNLEDFWFNTLSPRERNEVRDRFGSDSASIDEEYILNATMKKYDFLMLMAEGISDKDKKQFLINWSIKEAEKARNIIDLHYIYMQAWKQYKQLLKTDKSLYTNLIEILKKDCEIHDEFNKKYSKQFKVLPNYPAFKELALAYERLGKIKEALEVSRLALEKKVQENTSFERRIAKLEKKLK